MLVFIQSSCAADGQGLQNLTFAYSQAALMLIAIASGHNQHSNQQSDDYLACNIEAHAVPAVMSASTDYVREQNKSPARPVCHLYLQSDLLHASKDWPHRQLESGCSRPAALASPARMSAASVATRACAGQTLAASLFQGLAAAREPGLPWSHHTLMTHLLRW